MTRPHRAPSVHDRRHRLRRPRARGALATAISALLGATVLSLPVAASAEDSNPTDSSSWSCDAKTLGLDDVRVELAAINPAERESDGSQIMPAATMSGAWVPVVLVHGWTARSTHPNTDGSEETEGTFSHLIDMSANRVGNADVGRSLVGQLQGIPGAAVFTFDYHPYSRQWITNNHLGPGLIKVVDCLTKASGQKTIVVGHSMGGLIGRYAATDGAEGTESIARLITLGTPNDGSVAAMLVASLVQTGGDVDVHLATLRLLLAECGRRTKQTMDPHSLCEQLPAAVSAFDGEAGRALRFGSSELKELNARPIPADLTINAMAGSTLMSFRSGWFGWAGQTSDVDLGDVVVDHKSATEPSSTVDDISCKYQISAERGAVDAVGLHMEVRTLNEVGDFFWRAGGGPCFHMSLTRSIELTNAVTAWVSEDIKSRPGLATSCAVESISEGYLIKFGRLPGAPSVVACDGSWAVFSSGAAGDSWSMMHVIDDTWTWEFGFPTSICRDEVAAAGASAAVLEAVNWSCTAAPLPGVPSTYPGSPLLGGYDCGALPADESGFNGSLVHITSGGLRCEDAMAVAIEYIATSRAQSARGVGFDGWECGMNSGSGRDMASSNMYCRRGNDSLTIG